MQRAVIFDFGGVLFKTRDYGPRHTWDDKLGLPHGSVERVVHGHDTWKQTQRGEIPMKQYWQAVADVLGISLKTASEELARDFYSGDVLDTAIVDLIHDLREKGHTVALLSNDSATLLRPRLERLKLTDLFEPLVISSEIGVMKPHADAYQQTLSQLGRPAEETIFIDDRPENIEGAQAVGIHGIHYQDGMDLSAALAPLLTMSR